MSVPDLAQPLSIAGLRKMIYEDDILTLDPSCLQFWNNPITNDLDTLLDNVFKLSCLGKKLEQYPKSESFFTPYNDKKQVIRAYVKHKYVVLELNFDPENYSGWLHIFEHHKPDNKSSGDFYKFKLPINISNDTIHKLVAITDMIVETVEQYVLDLINNKTTVLEMIHKIRILDKTESEIIDEEKIRFETRKKLEKEEKELKKEQRVKNSFFGHFKFGNKVIFS